MVLPLAAADPEDDHGCHPTPCSGYHPANLETGAHVFEWGYLGADGTETGQSDPFETQADAELWFAMNWEPLSATGTIDVVLRNKADGSEAYKMSLAPE